MSYDDGHDDEIDDVYAGGYDDEDHSVDDTHWDDDAGDDEICQYISEHTQCTSLRINGDVNYISTTHHCQAQAHTCSKGVSY